MRVKNKKVRTGVIHHLNGAGNVTIDLDWQPEFMRANFLVGGHPANTDKLWLEIIAVTPVTFQLVIHYAITHPRSIKWVVADLPKLGDLLLH